MPRGAANRRRAFGLRRRRLFLVFALLARYLFSLTPARAREGRAQIRAAAPPIYFWRMRFAVIDGDGGRGVVS